MNSVKTFREKIKYFSTTSFSRFIFTWCKLSLKSFFPSSGSSFFSSFKNDWLRRPTKFKFAYNDTYWEHHSWHILEALSYWQSNVKLLNLNLTTLQLWTLVWGRIFKIFQVQKVKRNQSINKAIKRSIFYELDNLFQKSTNSWMCRVMRVFVRNKYKYLRW